MNSIFKKGNKKFVADGTYPAMIEDFSYYEDYVMGVNSYSVYKTVYDVSVNGKMRTVEVVTFYSEDENSECAAYCDKLEKAVFGDEFFDDDDEFRTTDDLIGKFVDITVKNCTSQSGNHYYKVTDIAPFSGHKKWFSVSSAENVSMPKIPNNTASLESLLDD